MTSETKQHNGCTRDIDRSISNWRITRSVFLAVKNGNLRLAKMKVQEYENYNGVIG